MVESTIGGFVRLIPEKSTKFSITYFSSDSRYIMRILIIRFRQMGDAILATPICNTIRHNFPNATIDIVLNENIAPLFDGHEAIDNVIRFSNEERHNILKYIHKVWNTVNRHRYDVIIDMRSTVNTMVFALLSPATKYRIGLRKPYTNIIFNYRFPVCRNNESMVDHNLGMLSPLDRIKSLTYNKKITLTISDKEKNDFREYMRSEGIDFNRPVMLAGVTAKLESKTWRKERMTEILRRFIGNFPDVQIIFNYAPGKEEENAREIYNELDRHPNIFIDIKAGSPRQLAAMAQNCTFYFGNEGGARHIAHAMGTPSFVICSPCASKHTWIPQGDGILADSIAPADIVADVTDMTYMQLYDVVSTDIVWDKLLTFCKQLPV